MHLFVKKKKNMTFFQGPAKKNVIIVGEDMFFLTNKCIFNTTSIKYQCPITLYIEIVWRYPIG
jgi:hypothetical protein